MAVLMVSAALLGPAAADGSGRQALLAEGKADCTDAKAHFEVAKEIGTREALQVHIDNYGDCSFAPFAKMLMDRLPAAANEAPGSARGTQPATSAAAPSPAATSTAPSAGDEAKRVADAFVGLLNEAPAAFGMPNDRPFSYESVEAADGDTKIVGLQTLSPGTGSLQTRLRFAEARLVKPKLSASGSLSAERIEISGGETRERHPGEDAWVPVLNPDGFQLFVDRIALQAPTLLARNESAEDAIGGRLKAKSVELSGWRLLQRGKPFMSLASASAETNRVEKSLPYQLTAKVDALSVSRAMLESEADFDVKKTFEVLGLNDYVLGFQLDFEADSAKRTIAVNRFSTSMNGGFGSSVILRLSGVDLAQGLDDLLAGGRPDGPLKGLNVDFATAAYFDSGLVPKLFGLVAARSGLDADLLKGVAPAQAQAAALAFLGDAAMAGDISAATTEFLATPKSLGLTFAPNQPVNIRGLVAPGPGDPAAIKAAIVSLRTSLQVNRRPSIDLYRPLQLASLPPETREAIETCHRLAADSDDPRKLAPGIKDPADIDVPKALPACEAAQKADPLEPLLAFELGRVYAASGNATLANSFYNLAAVGGHDVAKFELAAAALNGSGMSADPAAAVEGFEAIADRLPIARSTLASLYANGTGIPADPAKAIEIWRAGAEKGEAESAYNLGIELILGSHVAADPLKGREELRKAADRGHADAMAELGKSFYRGDGGTPPDYTAAYDWATRAAEAGSAIGEANLGFMLASGLGTERADPKKAADLLLRALSKGDADAEAYLISDKAKTFDPALRKAVQAEMKAEGRYDGPATGLFGRGTMDALKAIRDAARG